MTEAEMQDVLDKQKADFKEKMDAMDAKLTTSEKNFKDLEKKHRSSDEASQKYYDLEDKHSELKELYSKQERELSKSIKENEKLTHTNEGLHGTNTKLIIDDGLSKELMGLERFSVRNGGMDVTIEALKKLNPTIVDGKAMFGDKSASEFVGEWANSKESGFYLQAKENSGGGGNGGGQGGSAKKLSEMSEAERNSLYRENPDKFNELASGQK